MDSPVETTSDALPAPLEAYLLSHRGVMAPVIEEAVCALDLPRDGVVLDAGTGAGGALGPLAAAVPEGRVVGVDVDPRVLALAGREIVDRGVADRAELRTLDVASALADPPAGGYAAVWSGELLWPGNVGLLASGRSQGVRAGMTPEDLAEIERLLDPDSTENLLDEPGRHAVLPVVLATGRVPAQRKRSSDVDDGRSWHG